MELSVKDPHRLDIEPPDAGGRIGKPEKDQLRAFQIRRDPIVNSHAGRLQQKLEGCTDIGPDGKLGGAFTGWRGQGDGEDIGDGGPKLHGKSDDTFANSYFCRMICVDIRDLVIVVVAFVCFISAADDRNPVDGGTVIVQNDRTGKSSDVPSCVGAEGKAENKRKIQFPRQKMQIAQG